MFNDYLLQFSFSAKLYTSVEEKELKMLECWLKLSRWKDCARKYTDLILHKYVRMYVT